MRDCRMASDLVHSKAYHKIARGRGLPHGFGLGTGTVAEGWIDDAVKFWEKQMKDNGTTGMTPMLYGKLSHTAKYYRQQENDKK